MTTTGRKYRKCDLSLDAIALAQKYQPGTLGLPVDSVPGVFGKWNSHEAMTQFPIQLQFGISTPLLSLTSLLPHRLR